MQTLTPDAAARAAGVGRTTIYHALAGRRGPLLESVRLGRRRIILPERLARWLQERAQC